MLDLFVTVDGKKMRLGYTTGSCAVAASKAAALMLTTGTKLDRVSIDTPAGIKLNLEVLHANLQNGSATCAIQKNAGDDPDSTDGIEIYAQVKKRSDGEIKIEGGVGIGRISRKGLFGKVGESAINPVPRKLISEELKRISDNGFDVLIYAPDGERIAKKTFNKNIGIVGGISIIGTRGIVYPKSEEAYKKTIELELHAIKANEGVESILLVPGAHGIKIASELGIKMPALEVSNFIGFALTTAYMEGFRNFYIVGHIGKLAKTSIGIFQTHNRIADTRMEAFVYYLALRKAPVNVLKKTMSALTAEEASEIIIEYGYENIFEDMEKGVCNRVKTYLKADDVKVHCHIYSMKRLHLYNAKEKSKCV
ncbi:MAG: cobalt-precorrin-5B (C(1))-methyltransferase CbiD [Treponemataceae bacterium]